MIMKEFKKDIEKLSKTCGDVFFTREIENDKNEKDVRNSDIDDFIDGQLEDIIDNISIFFGYKIKNKNIFVYYINIKGDYEELNIKFY